MQSSMISFDKDSLEKIKQTFAQEPRLIEIEDVQRIIFVGDTHGDLEASQKVVRDYLKLDNVLIFLGDYVDRGHFSRENLDFLLKTKIENSSQIYLLQGNHEGHRILELSPANFWEGLNSELYNLYASIVEKFPLIAVAKGIIALHGVFPDVKNLEEINQIELGSKKWEQITWGDFAEQKGEQLAPISVGRPLFGRDWFLKIIHRLNKKILIRSHQPRASQFMFDNRCLTIFSSSVYGRERTIAIADLSKPLRDARDLKIKVI